MSMDEHDVYQPPCPGCGYGVNTNDSERCRWADEAYWHRECLLQQERADEKGPYRGDRAGSGEGATKRHWSSPVPETPPIEDGQAREDLTACSTREESASPSKDTEDAMPKQIEDRMDFQIQCNKVLSLESPERFNRLGVFGVLTPAEMEQADAFCAEGGTGTEFGIELAHRDRLAASPYECIDGCGKKMLGPFRCPDCFAKWVLGAPKNQARVSA